MMVHDMEQGTPEWHEIRLGKPTGSCADQLVTPTGKLSTSVLPYAQKLAAEIFLGEEIDAELGGSWGGNKYTQYGKDHEPLARNWHSFTKQVDVLEVGFCTDDLIRYGASPDGLIGKVGAWDGGSEYKCFPVEHVPAMMYFNKHGTAPPKQIPQTQMELFVCELEWLDLVYYHKRLPSFIIRVTRDESFIAKLESQLAICLEHRDEALHLMQQMQEAA